MTDLIQKYGLLRFNNGPLSAKFTYATAKAKYGAFFAWVEGMGIPQALIMTINEFAAAWNNEVWEGDGYAVPNQGPYSANGCQSRVNINAEQLCHAKINIPLLVCFGRYIGGGSGNYTELTTANGGPGSTDGTCIEIDHAGWLSQWFPERFCLMTTTWNNDTILGYSESFIIDGFRLEGGKAGTVHDPSYISAGIGIWDSGETSEVHNVYSIGFNSYGFMNVRGTPSTFNTCSPFSNGIFGFGLIGCDLSTITLSSPSGDDNGALIGIRAGYGRPGGATLTVLGAKNESGKRQPYRKQKFIDAQGACNIIVCGAWVHAIDSPECVIAVDFQTYPGALDVSGLRYDGYPLSLKLTSNGVTKTYSGPGGMLPVSFVATEAGVISSSRSMGGSAPPPPPVEPPPPPPPPPGGVKYTIAFEGKNVMALPGCIAVPSAAAWRSGTISGKALTTTSNTYQKFTTPITATKMVLTGITVKESAGYKFLSDEVRTLNGKFVLASNMNTVLGSFTVNQKANVTLTFPAPVNIAFLLGSDAFNTLLLSVEGIELS